MNATIKPPEQYTEAEVRALRDRVYGHAATDRNWNGCKENWMHPDNIRWLISKDGNCVTATSKTNFKDASPTIKS